MNMNAAVRAFDARPLTRQPLRVSTQLQTAVSKKAVYLLSGLFLMTLLSSVTVVYMKDLSRRMFINYQGMQQVETNSHLTYGKLLLEQSTLATQARIQNISTTKLDMVMPSVKSTKVINL